MASDLRMAWRNIWRNTRRSIITISAMVFASGLLVFMLSLQLGSYQSMIDSSVKIRTGHLQVQARGYHEQEEMWQVVPDPGAVSAILNGLPQVAAHAFRANSFSIVSHEDRTFGVLVIGIDPERETQVSTLKATTHQGSYLSPSDGNQVLVGELLAKNLHVGLGDEVTILGQGADGSIAATVAAVKGIYTSGQSEFDRNTLHMPLKTFQEVYTMPGAVHEAVVICNSLGEVAGVKQAVSAAVATIEEPASLLSVLDWMDLLPGLIQMIQMDFYSGVILYLILVVVVAFSIFNTFLMAMFERTKEFGMMMALGTTPGRLTRLLLMESMIMAAVGVVIGTILGCLTTWYFQVHGINLGGMEAFVKEFGLSSTMNPRLSLFSALAGPGAVLVFTFLIALYPALRIRRLRPVEAMQRV